MRLKLQRRHQGLQPARDVQEGEPLDDFEDGKDLKQIRTGKLGMVAAVTAELCEETQQLALKHGLTYKQYFSC
jgi:hypothetical protein